MIASWMLYCALCALGLALAAVVAERALLAGRGSVRHVWFGAVVLSLIVPVVAFRYAPRRVTAVPAIVATSDTTPSASITGAATVDTLMNAAASTAPTVPTTPSAGPVNWRGFINRADRPLTIAWLTLSFALAVHFLIGLILLARTRRAWRERDVLGVRVLVSDRTGPALVGAVSPAIVVPEWALGLEPGQLALMLRHEQEHQRAHDGQLLFAAQLALIAMPWNVALWWQILRLRVAVELDCDARVLRDADARSYGNLLLEVIRPRPTLAPLGVASFAEHATQLERRIRVMTRPSAAVRGARVLAACVVLAAISIAWIAPVPAKQPQTAITTATAITSATATTTAPATTTAKATTTATAITTPKATPTAPAITAPTADSVVRAQPRRPPARVMSDSGTSGTLTHSDSGRVDSTPPAAAGRGGRGGGRGAISIPNQVDLYVGRLFDSIALTPDQLASARALVTSLVERQRAAQDSALPGLMAFQTKAAELRAERDTVLMSVLSNEVDRGALRSRLVPAPGGRGQRGGGGAAPTGQVPPIAVGRANVLGGGGRASGPGGVPDVAIVVDQAYTRLFEGIVVTPEQEARARAAILKTETDRRAAQPPPMRQLIGMNPFSGVVIEAKTDSALMALLSNDADKQKLRTRMVNPPSQRVP